MIRNYENALKKIGGSVPYRKSDDFITMKVVKNGKETWAEINSEVNPGSGEALRSPSWKRTPWCSR